MLDIVEQDLLKVSNTYIYCKVHNTVSTFLPVPTYDVKMKNRVPTVPACLKYPEKNVTVINIACLSVPECVSTVLTFFT